MGGLGRDGKAETGTTLLPQAVLSKWDFHTVPGTHTTPGSRNLSTGTENKSLVDDASKETRPEPIHQAACPSAGHVKAAAQEGLSPSRSSGRRCRHGRHPGHPWRRAPRPLSCRFPWREKLEAREGLVLQTLQGFSTLDAGDVKTSCQRLLSHGQAVTESQPATQETALPALPSHPLVTRRHQGHQALEADAVTRSRFVGQGTSPASPGFLDAGVI